MYLIYSHLVLLLKYQLSLSDEITLPKVTGRFHPYFHKSVLIKPGLHFILNQAENNEFKFIKNVKCTYKI